METKKFQIVGSLISTDDTLTEQGVAADAAATGKAIQSAIEHADTKLSLDGGLMTGALDMGGNGIGNIDAAIMSTMRLDAGDGVNGLNVSIDEVGNSPLEGYGKVVVVGLYGDSGDEPAILRNLHPPVDDTDAANKAYVDGKADSCVSKSGGTMTGNLAMSGKAIYCASNVESEMFYLLDPSGGCAVAYDGNAVVISNEHGDDFVVRGVASPVENNDAANKEYVEEQLANYLPLSGGTMDNADIDGINAMWAHNFVFMTDDDQELLIAASNFEETDSTDGAAIFELGFETRARIKNAADPVDDNDVATKRFVAAAIAAALEEIPFAEDSTF